MKQVNTTTKYEQMGIAALLPGMTYAIELVQKQLDEMRGQLEVIMSGGGTARKVGRPKGSTSASRNGWAGMTPEERSAEMRRRQMVAVGKAEPRAKKRGTTKEGKIGSYQKQLWASYTPAQRKKRIAAARAGFMAAKAAKAKHVNGAAA